MISPYVDGRFLSGSPAMPLSSIEPATGRVLAEIAVADERTVDVAVTAARTAFDDGRWTGLPGNTRAQYLRAFANALEEEHEKIARLETRDTGMPITYTLNGHVPRAIALFEYFSAEAERRSGTVHEIDDAYVSMVVREPLGVVVILVPWNSPLTIASASIAAALAAGNTCVVKPSEYALLSIDALAKIADALELPPGVLNIIYGGPNVGKCLVRHPLVDGVSFTGSLGAAREIVQSTARMPRTTLELGGKSPMIVFEDASIEAALDGTILASFASNGETCMAGSRLLVQKAIFGEFTELFARRADAIRMGDPLEPETEMGPLISKEHADRVRNIISQAIANGADVLTRRPTRSTDGSFLAPVVLSGNLAGSLALSEELFAPVVCALPFDDGVAAIREANATEYGLAAYVWSETSHAIRIARALRAGSVMLNTSMVRDIRAPFGGFKNSGVGRVGGSHSIEAFTELKTICVPVAPYNLPRLGMAVEIEGSV